MGLSSSPPALFWEPNHIVLWKVQRGIPAINTYDDLTPPVRLRDRSDTLLRRYREKIFTSDERIFPDTRDSDFLSSVLWCAEYLESLQLDEIDKSQVWDEELLKRWRSLGSDGWSTTQRCWIEGSKLVCAGMRDFLPYDKSRYPTDPPEASQVVYAELGISRESASVINYTFYLGADPQALSRRHLCRWRDFDHLLQGIEAGRIQEEDFFFVLKGEF